MAPSTQTVVEEDSIETMSSPVNRPVTGEERADLLERDGQRSSWPDMINKATEINLNIGGLQVSFRIGVAILLVLVLCIVSIARWPTSSSPTGSQSSDAPMLDLSDISPVNVSTAEDTESPHTPVSLENKDSTVVHSSKTQPAQTRSPFSPAIAGFADGEVPQVLEKAIQGLRYPTDQNETIEELQALNRELILKAYQEVVQETEQTSMEEVLAAMICAAVIAFAARDYIRWIFHVSIRALLFLYVYRGFSTPRIDADEPDHNPWRRYTV